MLKGFKQFILRGNVVDLAVGVLIGAAFSSVVNAMVKDILTPFIGVVFAKPDFSQLIFTVRGSEFLVGDFINNIISFFISAATVYFGVVAPINALVNRAKRGKEHVDPTTKNCPQCVMEIPLAAKRCPHCTSEV